MKEESAAAVLGGERKKPAEPKDKKKAGSKAKHKVREINIRRGHAGGYIARNHLESGPEGGAETHEYPLANEKQLHEHLDEHMCGGDEAEEAAGAGAQ